MQTIITKYRGADWSSGSKIYAKATNGVRVTVGYDDSLNSEENHAAACRALAKKLGWHGTLAGGHTKDGMVWVFVETNPSYIVTLE